MRSPNPIPDGFHSVTPYLTVKDAARAIEWYKQAFGAVGGRILRDKRGVIAYGEIRIGDSFVMLCDEDPYLGPKGRRREADRP